MKRSTVEGHRKSSGIAENLTLLGGAHWEVVCSAGQCSVCVCVCGGD